MQPINQEPNPPINQEPIDQSTVPPTNRHGGGPKTPEGKRRSSLNAIKHGFFSNLVLLSNESELDYEIHKTSYEQRFEPADHVERDVLDQLVAASWRLRRAWGMETTAFETAMQDENPIPGEATDQDLCQAMKQLLTKTTFLANLSHHESRLARQFHRNLRTLTELRAHRKKKLAKRTHNSK
jgi:hypothetical protein